ncbi:hypothetical protein Hbl1158_09165 [Halobaculum sp. CBA1158]|uniref:hypothetical protein n=1 Tax=Halobaculum sp. CBA1158 TaxID=2904243 RepID=UPI001F255C80|nr:hypothetical protein [Halobaculum sp. CBA1158]UIO98717.1 hypothetical protein Hbl1158_09165 [Halobaculum sp. CBA1158]
MTGTGRANAVGALHADAESLAAAATTAGGDHVAFVADGTVDAWHARLEAGSGPGGTRCLVSVDDTVRGASASTAPSTRRVGDVMLSAVEAPVDDPASTLHDLLSVVDPASGGSVIVDDPGVLLPADADPDAVVDDLLCVAAEFGVELHAVVAGDGPVVAALFRRLPTADAAADRALADRLVSHLRETDPTNFGYLRRYWREARRGLAAVEMTYPQSKQIHAALPDPETTPRTLGASLRGLVAVGALGVWGDTVAATRYDLTEYDPAFVDAVGAVLDDIED